MRAITEMISFISFSVIVVNIWKSDWLCEFRSFNRYHTMTLEIIVGFVER
jgi:hypothetical protein